MRLRDFEPVRLLGLQFIGRLLVGLPFEKKGSKIFNISVGRSKSLSESHKKISLDTQPVFFILSDRLFKFPQTDLLCATLFDVLLGGASPKQILLKHNQLTDRKTAGIILSSFLLKENGWNSWLLVSVKLDVLMNYKWKQELVMILRWMSKIW